MRESGERRESRTLLGGVISCFGLRKLLRIEMADSGKEKEKGERKEEKEERVVKNKSLLIALTKKAI